MKNRVTLDYSVSHDSSSNEESQQYAATILSTVLIKSAGKIQRIKHEVLGENQVRHVFRCNGCEFSVITTNMGSLIQFTGEAPNCALFTLAWIGKSLIELGAIKSKKVIRAQIPAEVLVPDGLFQLQLVS